MDPILDIKKMWRDIFGDSAEYVNMIIDGYFDDTKSVIVAENNQVIASSLVIPYNFRCFPDNISPDNIYKDNIYNNKSVICGYYLCGLMTLPERRGCGIMKDVIGRIEANAIRNNVDFTFLIPADGKLRKYYEKLGYKNSSKRGIIKFRNILQNICPENFKYIRNINTEDNVSSVVEISNNLSSKFFQLFKSILYSDNDKQSYKEFNDIVSRILKSEIENTFDNRGYVYIQHSTGQWRDILADHLRDNGSILLGENTLILITENNNIFPIFGTPENIWSIIKNIVSGAFRSKDSGSDNNNNRYLESQDYTLYVADPHLWSSILELLNINEMQCEATVGDSSRSIKKICNFLKDGIVSNCGNRFYEIEVRMEYYGMAKSFIPSIDESDIVISMMFD
ncbi:MAG: GNAT family N-acetyltransferase [Muribaculaceae bacterium]|nr:GNAT family N-acetyltransferase [Muribaculaceae bacterium]